MTDLVIRAQALGKEYRLAHAAKPHDSLRDALTSAVGAPLRRFREASGTSDTLESFWALRDVSFDVRRGEVLGVIGRNGAGKSTLLKILSRIVEPTEGEVVLHGRVASLLEVGTGFHPELTGRENIYLNGSILGMRRREIDTKFDEIVDFAEVERFLDTPVKRYSSGMYVRLAFAVAAHLDPDVLIVDEVLAVGDAQFQQKCIGKMRSIADRGSRTVVFVSHNMGALRSLCSSGLLLKAGRIAMQGSVQDAIREHMKASFSQARGTIVESAHGIALVEAGLYVEGQSAPAAVVAFQQSCEIRLRFRTEIAFEQFGVLVWIHDEQGVHVSTLISYKEGLPPFRSLPEQTLVFRVPKMSLMPSRYVATVSVQRPHDATRFLNAEDYFSFEVLPALLPDSVLPYQSKHGITRFVEGCEIA